MVFGSLGVGRFASDVAIVGVVYAVVAAVAALQITDAWVNRPRSTMLRSTAAACAFGVGVSAMFGARILGLAILAAIAAAIVVAVVQLPRRRKLLATVALILQAALPVGIVASSVTLTIHYEIGAAVVLLAVAMAFDVGDFLIGSGAGSTIEGPIAGAIMIALVGSATAIIGAPPFHGALAWAFAAGAIVLCPLGQVLASALLPDARIRCGALRRLDSLLLVAPLWAWTSGIVAAHG